MSPDRSHRQYSFCIVSTAAKITAAAPRRENSQHAQIHRGRDELMSSFASPRSTSDVDDAECA